MKGLVACLDLFFFFLKSIMKALVVILLLCLDLIKGGPWTPENSKWNINQNKAAKDVKDYAVDWPGHVYFPSPQNWRMPFYTIMPDRYKIIG